MSPLSTASEPPQDAVSSGFPVLAKGFRPFFLVASLWAVFGLGLWLLTLHGSASARGALSPFTWHAHEMIFGYALAVIAGFLLTAVGHWTGREVVGRKELGSLVVLWLLGRASMLIPEVGVLPGAVLNLAFTSALGFPIVRAIVGAKNRRNFIFLGMLALLLAGQGLFNLEHLGYPLGKPGAGLTLALNVVILMIVVVAGRVVPMFTRNGASEPAVRSSPVLDRLAIGSVVAVTLADLLAPFRGVWLLPLAAGIFTLLRAWPWYTPKLWKHPLLWILHLGYLWIPVGLFARGFSSFWPTLVPLATHALTVGGIGGLTLGMMSRVTLGHTGRELQPPQLSVVAFGLMLAAALFRTSGVLLPRELYMSSLTISGLCWMGAFSCFLAAQSSMWLQPRVDGAPG